MIVKLEYIKDNYTGMKLNEIQENILKWISENLVATEIIRQNVFDGLDRSVSDEEITAALLGLHATGFLTSYIYDNQIEKYALIKSPDEYSIDVLYWLATQEEG